MSVTIAKSAGFCFGVNRAVEMVESCAAEGKHVVTLGPIIHNPQVIEDLEKKGVIIISEPEEAPKGYEVVIRAHGVTAETYEKLEKSGVKYTDATCPFVTKIHRIVEEKSKPENIVMIAGSEADARVGLLCLKT